jgi:alkylation response protein AidB-like acyl-CoA dehydrogenase
MDLTPGPEQESIRDTIRGVLAARVPLARVRAVVCEPPGLDADLWREAAQLGWLGLGLPEAEGGAGYGVAEEMLVFVELGRALTPGPWLGTVLAAHALAGTPAAAEVLAGARRVAVADDASGACGADGRLGGELGGIADLAAADAVLVLGRGAVRLVDARGAGIVVVPQASIDPTRGVGTLGLTAVAAASLAADPEALRARATILVAAEAVGVAEATLDASVTHAKTRQQFGRPIGAFQAVKHRCADMAVRTEAARSAVAWAAVALAEGRADVGRAVHVAKALAARAAVANAADNVQNHGGMGYTWEADAHLYLKRAWLLEQTFGTRRAHLDALAVPWRT